MPICGYLVYPVAGKSDELVRTLGAIPECDVQKSENRDVMLLVTDTADETHEERLQNRLKSINSILCLAMTFAGMDESPQEEKKS